MLSERPRSKNSGGGNYPAAIGRLIEGPRFIVNGFRTISVLSKAPAMTARKVW